MDSHTLDRLSAGGDFNARTWRSMKQFMEWFLHGVDSFPRRPIFGCIIAGLTMDLRLSASACIAKGGKGFAIAISAGSPLQVYNALIRLLTVPHVLTRYRSVPPVPLDRPPALPLLTGDGGVKVLFGNEPSGFAVLPDPTLQTALGKILTLTMQFLFLHELSHVLVGHVHASAEIRRDSHRLSAEERQAFLDKRLLPLEFLADNRARLLLSAFLNSGVAGARRYPDTSIAPDVLEHLHLLGFGLGVLFLLLEVSPFSGMTHPSAIERAYCLRAYTASDPHGQQIGFEHVAPEEGYCEIDRGFDAAIEAWDALGWGRSSLPVDGCTLIDRINSVEQTVQVPPCMNTSAG